MDEARPLSERLRLETRAMHEQVEAAFDLDRSLSSVGFYGELLGRLHGLHLAFEAAAAPHLAETRFASRLARSADLAADLAALTAGSPPDSGGTPLRYHDRAEALGGLYVVEGSHLGGLVIARAVENRLGAGAPRRFFSGNGRATASGWRSFCADLDRCADPEAHDRVIEGALATFALFERCFAAGRMAA